MWYVVCGMFATMPCTNPDLLYYEDNVKTIKWWCLTGILLLCSTVHRTSDIPFSLNVKCWRFISWRLSSSNFRSTSLMWWFTTQQHNSLSRSRRSVSSFHRCISDEIEQNSCVIVKFSAILGYWLFMQIRQGIFNCTDMQITHFILDKILKLLTHYMPFYLSLVVAKLSDPKSSSFFWPTL